MRFKVELSPCKKKWSICFNENLLKIMGKAFYSILSILLPSKWNTLSRCFTKLIHFAKNYPIHWTASRTNIFCKYIVCIFQFWAWFLGFLFQVISKSSSFLWLKSFEIIFVALYFYLSELKNCVSDYLSDFISNWRY